MTWVIVSALKHLMKRVLEKLMDATVTVDDDEDEEELEQDVTPINKSVHCSLNTLCDWYNTRTKVAPPPRRPPPASDRT